MIPEEVAYQTAPKRFYTEYLDQYEKVVKEVDANKKKVQIDRLVKASYIEELEIAVAVNKAVFRRKSSYYTSALRYGLSAVIPYLVCLGFHIAKKEDKTQKVEIVNTEINSKLHELDSMANIKPKETGATSTITTTPTTTRLPGVDSSQVIPARPDMIKEGSPTITTKQR